MLAIGCVGSNLAAPTNSDITTSASGSWTVQGYTPTTSQIECCPGSSNEITITPTSTAFTVETAATGQSIAFDIANQGAQSSTHVVRVQLLQGGQAVTGQFTEFSFTVQHPCESFRDIVIGSTWKENGHLLAADGNASTLMLDEYSVPNHDGQSNCGFISVQW